MGFWICATCAVEHAEPRAVCAICADERQYVPADGQRWTTLDELSAAGHRVEVAELEPDLHGLIVAPKAGIGQTAKLVRTAAGDRKSTRLNSSHANISYAVFCLKKN